MRFKIFYWICLQIFNLWFPLPVPLFPRSVWLLFFWKISCVRNTGSIIVKEKPVSRYIPKLTLLIFPWIVLVFMSFLMGDCKYPHQFRCVFPCISDWAIIIIWLVSPQIRNPTIKCFPSIFLSYVQNSYLALGCFTWWSLKEPWHHVFVKKSLYNWLRMEFITKLLFATIVSAYGTISLARIILLLSDLFWIFQEKYLLNSSTNIDQFFCRYYLFYRSVFIWENCVC